MNRLLMIGLNHRTAPLPLRERLAFDEARQRVALHALRERFPTGEFVLLSTCNRVELYVSRPVHEPPKVEQLVQFVAEFQQIPADQLSGHTYESAGSAVVAHLFEVASSLDSMVVGERQILGQVRDAYEVARELGAAGAGLHSLFQNAIATARKVHAQSGLGDANASVPRLAVARAAALFPTFAEKSIVCVGAGEMAAGALRGLAALRPRNLVILNRDIPRAQRLARRYNAAAVSLDRLDEHLVSADLFVTAAAAPAPIVTRRRIEPALRLRDNRPLYIVDIAVPRNVEPEVGAMDKVHLDDLESLQDSLNQTADGDVALARQLIAEAVRDFLAAEQRRIAGPIIERLSFRLNELVDAELSRVGDVSPAQRRRIEQAGRSIVDRLLRQPIAALENLDPSDGSAARLAQSLERLFTAQELAHERSETSRDE